MPTDLITALARGNQEAFHSAFIAWLLDKNAPHSLGPEVLQGFLRLLGFTLPSKYTVETEPTDQGRRFDIVITSEERPEWGKGLVIENKTKRSVQLEQLQQYQGKGEEGEEYTVAALALLWKNPDGATPGRLDGFPIVDYWQLREAIREALARHRSDSNPYHFIIDDYLRYLDDVLRVLDALAKYSWGEIPLEHLKTAFSKWAAHARRNQNDWRVLSQFYFAEFSRYLKDRRPELIFGSCDDFTEAKKGRNTCWVAEKNMRSRPFVLAQIWDFSEKACRFRLRPELERRSDEAVFFLEVRLDLDLRPEQHPSAEEGSQPVGKLKLKFENPDGSKNQRLEEALARGSYELSPPRKGSRTDHGETVRLRDIRFATMADRLKRMMEKVGYFE
jgi:hypothetical protein